jgi:lipopolysaccharide assembly outer membrane protein LptD (OstA)
MPKLRAILPFIVLLCTAATAWGADAEEPWVIDSDNNFIYKPGVGTITLTNGVTIRHQGAVLKARRARLNMETGECMAEGDVRLEGDGKVWTSDKLRYNFKTRQIVGEDFKVGQPPYFAKGEVFVGEQAQGVYVLLDGLISTDDNTDPNYHIKAKTLTLVPGHYIECENATVYLGDVPIFWWPKLRRSLREHRNFWTLTPGYRNKYGAYLLTTYESYWNERLRTRLHLDGRTTRGPGVGPDVLYNVPHFGEGEARYYYTYDDRPGRNSADEEIDHHRQRAWFEHQGTLRTNLSLKAAVRYQSDSQIVRDFFLTEYHDNAQPASYVELAQSWNNWVLNAFVQPRVNEFQETVERLPDVRLTGLRQQLGPTPFYYESETSFGYFQREFAYDATNGFSAARADTFHQVLLPWTFFNWLTVTPRAGGRFTYYGEAHGPGAATDERERWVFNTGAEASTKLSRTWSGARSPTWDLDGVRHVVQPSVNYVWVPNPSEPLEELPQFDYELPTTRLLPITFPDYNRLDSIDSQNVIRFGLRNRLQTKRSDQLVNFVNWSTYMDWRLRPNSQQRTFSDAYSDLDLRPTRWLAFSSQLAYDVNDTVLDVSDHWATLSPNDVWSVRLGHRYLRDGAFFGPTTPGHNLIYDTIYLRFNQNWGTRFSHYYNADDGLLQHQYYTVYRDFRSFTVGLTAAIRQSVGESVDYGVALTISAKAFPRYGLGEDVNKPNLLLGY